MPFALLWVVFGNSGGSRRKKSRAVGSCSGLKTGRGRFGEASGHSFGGNKTGGLRPQGECDRRECVTLDVCVVCEVFCVLCVFWANLCVEKGVRL
jgi:hypothetical protein